ncbi:TAXI family TRAP transporter solute-binding subunit [Algihabitans albus]|uniref:TAXI family TRAP transporter solute-binding subunit n=1 Tax=Algihabitans albus TaxID=2164067 RepID=UPI000E5CEC59|nr:TAXI family TRAP transporter solute-binding subunit [Algihabitans albus]
MKRFSTAAAAACSLMILAGGVAAQDRELLIGSTSSSSSHYGYFVAVTQVINEHAPGVSASVVETGATVDNLRRLSRGQIDLGLVTTNIGYHAYAGTNEFEGQPVDTRFLWVYTVAPQNVVVRSDAGVSELAALEGIRLNPGIRGSATEATTEAVFRTLGIELDYVRGSTSDIVAAVKDDRVAGYVKSGVGNKLDGSSLDIATFTDIQVIGLTEAQKGKLQEAMPDISVIGVPEGAGPGIAAYDTWAFGVGVVADPDLSEEAAYEITKAINENVGPQASAFGSLKGQDIGEMTMSLATVPLHPGALRYYREAGYDVPGGLVAQ